MPETHAASAHDNPDLISFLRSIPDGRLRRGVRYPQWFLLLVAILEILSGCRSSQNLERFARRHRQQFNQTLGLQFNRWPSDATFLYLFNRAHLQEFGQVLQGWMLSQIPGGAEGSRAAGLRWQDSARLSHRGRGWQTPVRRSGHRLRPCAWGRHGPDVVRHRRIPRASHSGIKYVTPNQRHSGDAHAICAIRQQTYEEACKKNPRRWSRPPRCWKQPEVVLINYPRPAKAAAA